MRLKLSIGLFGAVVAGFVGAPPAAATTYCVPGFHAACPNNGSNVAQADLQLAMDPVGAAGMDGVPDRIVIDAGTRTRGDSWELASGDTDPLEMVGAGPSATYITTSDLTNAFMMDLSNGTRTVTVRDLTLVAPASFPDNLGATLQAKHDVFENVDIEVRNLGSDAASSMVGGGVFRDGRIYATGAGSIDRGFNANGAEAGTLLVERTVIEHPTWGLATTVGNVPIEARRVKIADPVAYAARVSGGGAVTIENSVIETDDTGYAISAAATNSSSVVVNVRNSTLIGTPGGGAPAGIRAEVSSAIGNGGATVNVTDSVIDGFDSVLDRSAPVNPLIGNANINIDHSYLKAGQTASGDGAITVASTIDAGSNPPLFAGPGDYRPQKASPLVDAANPAPAVALVEDFDGALRPVDSTGGCAPRPDIGAFEYQTPVTAICSPPPTTSPATDTLAPVISKLRFRRGKLEVVVSESAKLGLTFRKRATASSRKAKAVKLNFTVKAGLNKLKLSKRKLRAGKYRVTAVATDSTGNRSKAKRVRVRIKR